jgi:hypothetical protein
MKYLLLLSFAIFLLFACGHEPKAEPECKWEGPPSDSVLLDDFRGHMKVRNAPDPFVPEADTMYRFRGHGGWGGFDYLCSIYCDSTGYKASLTNMVNRYEEGIEFEEKVRNIGVGEWQQIRSKFQKVNFWCDSLDYDERVCTDVAEYRLLAKEGNKFRQVGWDECETGLQSVRILSERIKYVCGFPNSPAFASYSIKGDSIFAHIYLGGHAGYSTQETEIQYHGKVLPFKEGTGRLTLHKRDLDSLRKVIITKHGIDGSVRRVNVTQLKRQH